MATPKEGDQWYSVRDAETGQFVRADGLFTALPQEAQFDETAAWALVEANAGAQLEVVQIVMRTVCNTGPFPFVYKVIP